MQVYLFTVFFCLCALYLKKLWMDLYDHRHWLTLSVRSVQTLQCGTFLVGQSFHFIGMRHYSSSPFIQAHIGIDLPNLT